MVMTRRVLRPELSYQQICWEEAEKHLRAHYYLAVDNAWKLQRDMDNAWSWSSASR